MHPKPTSQVFSVSNVVLPDSYVDRGDLDEQLRAQLARPNHIALRGVSKCGKSWLRQTVLPDAITIQCRLGKTVRDLYAEALAQLGVRLELNSTTGSSFSSKVEASSEVGISLLAKLAARLGVETSKSDTVTTVPITSGIDDLRVMAEIILDSGSRLVVEDFHYLSVEERKKFAFDLKALWDFGLFVVIIGVWSEQNMLLYLNPDLTGRVVEVPISWAPEELREILVKGGNALRIEFSTQLQERAIADCYQNPGILQTLILGTLDRIGIAEEQSASVVVEHLDALEHAELMYADQLNPLYQEFAQRVARGIRTRQNATGIYAHAMATVLSASDEQLIAGISLDEIYVSAHAREPRIQKGNLATVLEKIEFLQVDEDGRGLILAYNEANRELSVVDRQLLLYRKYSTVKWPWEDLVRQAEESGEKFDQV